MALQKLGMFLDQVIRNLFTHEQKRINDLIVALDDSNREIKGHVVKGFRYSGQVYLPAGVKPTRVQVPPLAFQLSSQGSKMVADIKAIEDDKHVIKQVLWLAIRDCETPQDVRDALPETFVQLAEALQGLPRTNEPGYTIRHDERLYAHFLEISEKIDVYWAYRLIY